MVKIRQNICPANKWHIKCPYYMDPEFIVVHDTANDASAANEIAYMNRNDNYTSYHFAVDDVEVVQGLPLNRNGWHAGDGAYGAGNRKGIGIEICYSLSGGPRFDQAERNAAWLIARLLNERGWGIDRIKKHQDFMNKYCPHRTLDYGWGRFIDMVRVELSRANQSVSPEQPRAELVYETLEKPKTVRLIRDTNLWDFNFTDWGKARAIKPYSAGAKIEVVAIAHNKTMNASYYITAYSWNNGNVRPTNGFNEVDCEDVLTPSLPQQSEDTTKTESESKSEIAPVVPAESSDKNNKPQDSINSNCAKDKNEQKNEKPRTGGGFFKTIINMIKQLIILITTKKGDK